MIPCSDPFDVIIVGCGAAGIGAAIKFQKFKPPARILLLEARNRIGGRAVTDIDTFGVDAPVDLGARWLCHHQPDNVLRSYYTPSNKDWIECNTYDKLNMAIFDEDGTLISDDLIEQAQTTVEHILTSVKQYPSEKIDISISQAIDEQLNTISNERMHRLVRMFLSFIEIHEGSDLTELSTKSYTQGEGSLEECDLAVANGLGSFIKQVAEQHNLPIELNAVVSHIDVSTRPDQLVHITTQDNRSYFCKYVLLTVSLGCLKARSIKFTPPLPIWKLEAIDQMGFSLLNKVYLQFPSIFWDPKLRRISVATDLFKNYFCIPETRILALYIAGSVARELEKKSDKEIIEQVVESLRRIYPLMSNPIKWLVTRWGSDVFSYGSYSTFHVGNEVSILRELARDSHENCVHWAGEHTNYEGSTGYVDSAFESGQREATRIQNNLKQEENKNKSEI
ncbi:unnamed protein product [Rotaria socialis]|uniref:Amine oxidase n=2 Tax=Rotaria socialis TaxID=392032 RepID=A0A820REE9_9BILA|nr:unnamed protein product [Rotaria socialis]CAF4434050.1 unnamed protein product [Rotaria socialis]